MNPCTLTMLRFERERARKQLERSLDLLEEEIAEMRRTVRTDTDLCMTVAADGARHLAEAYASQQRLHALAYSIRVIEVDEG